MASTILSNVIEPKVFTAYTTQQTTVKSALLNSGVLLQTPELNARAGQAGAIGEMPHFNPFAWSESNVASDDASAKSVPNALTAGSQVFKKDYRSKDWGTLELVESITGEDLIAAIGNVVSTYWSQELQRHILARLTAIELDNAANFSNDMIVNVANDATGTPTALQSANINTILDAGQTMGDAASKLSMIVMHSQVWTNLMKLEPLNCTVKPVSQTELFRTYLGKQVVIDDGVPAVQGTNRKTFTTYLLANGAFGYGEAALDDGTEIWRDPAAGVGFGEERLYSRKQFLMHPVGFSAAGAAVTARSKSPTLTQWAAAGALTRVYDRKNIPIAILKTNA